MSYSDDDRTAWGSVILLVGAGVVVAWQVGKVAAALPLLRPDLSLSLPVSGWVISMFNIVGIAIGSFAGALGDRLGHLRIILACMAILSLASLVGAQAQGASLILVSRLFEGVGFIGTVVSVPGLIVRVARPADLRLAFGMWGAYMPLGTATMMLLAPLVLSPFGWRGLWLTNAILVVAFSVCLGVVLRPLLRQASQRPPTPWEGIVRTTTSRGPLLLALTFGSYSLIFLTVFGFLPTLMVEQAGFDLATATILGAVAVALNVPGNLLGGWALHRGAQRWLLMVIAFVVMGLSSIGIYASAVPDIARYSLALLLSFIGGIIPTSLLAGSPVHAPRPDLVGTTNGVIMQGSQLGQTMGPPTTAALVVAWGGWQIAPVTLLISATVGIVCCFGVRALERGNINPV